MGGLSWPQHLFLNPRLTLALPFLGMIYILFYSLWSFHLYSTSIHFL